MLGVSLFSSAFAATLCVSPAPPVPVTPDLVLNVCDAAFGFVFGSNPLPDGGQIEVNGVDFVYSSVGNVHGYTLDLDFPIPSQRTTVLDYTVFGSPVTGFVLSAQGSSFSIDEKFVGSNLPDLNLNSSGTVTLGCMISQHCYPPYSVFSGSVMTTITDYAGDLAGFSETFVVPEPDSGQLFVGGLLCIGALLQMKSWLKKVITNFTNHDNMYLTTYMDCMPYYKGELHRRGW
jgi:hypothetical protein